MSRFTCPTSCTDELLSTHRRDPLQARPSCICPAGTKSSEQIQQSRPMQEPLADQEASRSTANFFAESIDSPKLLLGLAEDTFGTVGTIQELESGGCSADRMLVGSECKLAAMNALRIACL